MAQDIQLDVIQITREMAVSLAIMHWEARFDGMDAEWVLGSAATQECLSYCEADFRTMAPVDVELNFKKRATYLWILDFDKARTIEYDAECVELLLGGVTANDPYLPNPKSPLPL